MKEIKNPVSKRDYRIDNIKGILMLLVVYGHLLELILQNNPDAHRIYCMIYMFHMPAFIFTTGYFARCNVKKICFHLVYPYVIFETLYQIFVIGVLKSEIKFQYTTPYWLLWYLYATIIWTLTEGMWNGKWKYKLVRFINRNDVNAEQQAQNMEKVLDICVLSAFTVLSLICGRWEFIGREYSLSRILVFFPFFMAGTFARKWFKTTQPLYQYEEDLYVREYMEKVHIGIERCRKWFVLCLTVMILITVAFMHQKINRTWLYEATSYETSHYGMEFRLAALLTGIIMIWACMEWMPNRRWIGISRLGEHTLQIFLLHGFIIKLLEKHQAGQYVVSTIGQSKAVMILFITALGITYLLSANLIAKLMKPLTSFDFFLKQRAVQPPPVN